MNSPDLEEIYEHGPPLRSGTRVVGDVLAIAFAPIVPILGIDWASRWSLSLSSTIALFASVGVAVAAASVAVRRRRTLTGHLVSDTD